MPQANMHYTMALKEKQTSFQDNDWPFSVTQTCSKNKLVLNSLEMQVGSAGDVDGQQTRFHIPWR